MTHQARTDHLEAPKKTPARPWPSWVIFHVPHASRDIPEHARTAIVLDDAELATEVERLTDHYVDTLLVPLDAENLTVAATVSRFVVDVERFLNDEHEPMARVGMGAIYTRTTDGRPLRRPLTHDEECKLLDLHYHPHHQRLTDAVDHCVNTHGRALILDLHSFPHEPLPCDLDHRPNRPDICLGTDTLHTPPDLVDALLKHFKAAGFSVEVDRPYSGSIVPTKHHELDLRVTSVMIEVNRRLYLQPNCEVLAENAREVGMAVQNCLSSALIAWTPLPRNASTAR